LVVVNGYEMVGDAGSWVVQDAQGIRSTWLDPEFRAKFEPVDEAAARYLAGAGCSKATP